MKKGILVCSGITFGCSLVITIVSSFHAIGIDTIFFLLFGVLGLIAVYNSYRYSQYADAALVYLLLASLVQSIKAIYGRATYELIRGIDFALVISKAEYLKLGLSGLLYNADGSIPAINTTEVCINFGQLLLFACYFMWLVRDEAVSGKITE